MVFSNLFFIYAFLPICMLLYYVFKNIHWRNIILMIFSLIFYAWGEPFCVILMIITVFADYLFGIFIQFSKNVFIKKMILFIAVVSNLSCLGLFKYADFFIENINTLFNISIPLPEIALPIGISFYTFQILSYVIDVYRRDVEAQKSPFKLLLYIVSFHQLVAGPIVRYKDIAQEINCRSASAKDISQGIERFIIGLSKKAILANLCGELATNYLDKSAPELSGVTVSAAWFGIIMYTFQIYFDFSAYSDMAIGMGRMCGFHYLENFNYPYISRSVSEFWRRWHISLSSFFRDYVYIPLGGNRCSVKRQIFNLFLVWGLTGLWHGASWNFVLWGLFYFIFIAAEKLFLSKVLKRLPIISNIYLIFVVIVGWAIFYYTDIKCVFALLGSMFGVNGNLLTDSIINTAVINNIYLIAVCVLCSLPIIPFIKKAFEKLRIKFKRDDLTVGGLVVKHCLLAVLLISSTVMLVGSSYNPFIYFRF